jgi:hypothetical protein
MMIAATASSQKPTARRLGAGIEGVKVIATPFRAR